RGMAQRPPRQGPPSGSPGRATWRGLKPNRSRATWESARPGVEDASHRSAQSVHAWDGAPSKSGICLLDTKGAASQPQTPPSPRAMTDPSEPGETEGLPPSPGPSPTPSAPLPGSFLPRVLRAALALPVVAWGALVLVWAGGFGGSAPGWRMALALLWAAGALALVVGLRSRQRAFGALAGWTAPVLIFFLLLSPSNDRDWEAPSSRTAHATIDGREVTLHDVRDFRYAEDGSWEPAWYDATYDLDELERTWFVLTEFGEMEGLAHVMLSFEFSDDRFVVLSVEIRRQEGEAYHPVGGAFRQYELMYVVADERDALALRTLVHRDSTWLIPMRAGPEKSAEFFMDMVHRMNDLHEEPMWYNTLFNSCSSNLARHYERVNDLRLGWDRRIFLPGFGDELLEELDLLPEGMDRQAVRARFQVNDRALADGGSLDFSRAIREGSLPGR
ncbi:MAG: DUF4105 domain-containing protein, partial [Gemmatimonadales bacterium]